MNNMKRLVFKNGLRVLLAPEKSAVSTTVLILVEAGSEYEKKEQNGISHFLEHLVFKGTTNRPQAGMIASELDGLGAAYNAFTNHQMTGYWAKVQSAKAEKAVELVSDLYLNPIFESAEIEKERGVIIEEINLYEDTPARRVHELLWQLVYGDQPAGWDIGGEKEIIRTLNREDFVNYRSKHYVASATAVVVAGGFNEKKVLDLLKRLFGDLPRTTGGKKLKTRDIQEKPQVLIKHKESDQTHLALAVRAFPVSDKRRHALQVLANHLGGGMSSRLFQRIREELGAAYYVHASPDLLSDHGLLTVAAGVDHRRIEEVIAVILEEMKRLTKVLLTPQELIKTKDHLVGNFLLSLDTSDEIASFYGGQEILRRKLASPEEVVKKINGVRAEEIRQVARDLFVEKYLNLAVIGPYKDQVFFKKALRF